MRQFVSAVCLCLVINATASVSAPRSGFLSGGNTNRTVAMSEVELSLQASLRAILGGGQGKLETRFAAVEASIWQTFQALPKNSWGRLAARAVRYVVHNYFAKEHGWLIDGLAPHGMQANLSELHEVSILQKKAPALVEALLQARQYDHGLSLSNVVTMVVVLEQLIFNESIMLLEHAYRLNRQSPADKVSKDSFHDILQSYLLIFGQGASNNVSQVQKHQALKAALAKQEVSSWSELVTFEQDAVLNFDFARKHQTNHFVEQRYSFEVASRIVSEMTQDYGKWQNSECRQMKEALMELDSKGDGRIPLSTFYSQPEEAIYQFAESLEYLQKTGALDESVPGRPQVLIANYLLGPANCIEVSTYYSICCLSECETIMNEIEGKVKAPTASPERLLTLVGNISFFSMDTPRFSHHMAEKIHAIAEHHEGMVPLHGRLFAQWLHYAFPHECPFPQIAESSAILTPSAWLDGKAVASQEEKDYQIQIFDPVEMMPDIPMAQWTDQEVLIAHEPTVRRYSKLGIILGSVMQVVAFLAVLQAGLAAWKSAQLACSSESGLEKEKRYSYPTRQHRV